jgi:hypothetical protein
MKSDGAGAMKSARLCDMKICDFLVGAFWVVVTLFALLFWGTILRRLGIHRQGLVNATPPPTSLGKRILYSAHRLRLS